MYKTDKTMKKTLFVNATKHPLLWRGLGRPFLWKGLGRSLLLSLLFLLSFSPAGAQTFTERIQIIRAGQGVVTIHHDEAIDELVNGRHEATQPQRQGNNNQQQRQQQPISQGQNRQQDDPDRQDVRQQSDSIVTTPRRYRRVNGFKIQAFSGSDSRRDRQQAEHVRSELRTLFPGEEVTVHYNDPRWLCRMGNYATQAEAQEALAEVRRLGFPSATIVRARVKVPY